MNSFLKYDYQTPEIPSPCYVVEEELLHKNLELVSSVAKRADVQIIMAFKAFALWHLFPITRQYVPYSTASSLSEARLAMEYLGSKAHFCAGLYRCRVSADSAVQFAHYVQFSGAVCPSLQGGAAVRGVVRFAYQSGVFARGYRFV